MAQAMHCKSWKGLLYVEPISIPGKRGQTHGLQVAMEACMGLTLEIQARSLNTTNVNSRIGRTWNN